MLAIATGVLPGQKLEVIAMDTGGRRLGAGGTPPWKATRYLEVCAGIIASSRVEASRPLTIELRHLQQARRAATLAGLPLRQLHLRAALRLQLDLVEGGGAHLRTHITYRHTQQLRRGFFTN